MGKQNVGINIGSVSVNVVGITESGGTLWFKKPHLGNPQKVLDQMLENNFQSPLNYYGVSGSFGEISEIVAIERAIREIDECYDLILSLGGEAFVLYVLDSEKHIINVLSHDKCAAGSGEFFLQQIERLNLTLEDAIERAQIGNFIELASRCSVHCKSDITHKLNRGEAELNDILASVIGSMVNKVSGLIFQSRVDLQRMLIIGGVSQNQAFMKILRERYPDVGIQRNEFSAVFEAYGTALIVNDNPLSTELKLKFQKSFLELPRLHDFDHLVKIIEPKTFQKSDYSEFINRKPILGVDVGSTTTKAVLIDPDNHHILASYYGRTNGNPIKATRECIQKIIEKTGDIPIKLVGVTGSGRQIVGAYMGTPAVYNEISAHSEGAVYFDRDVDTIFEIGGQDSKYMYLQNGVPVDYAMNASCSAGTGSFLEESAKCDLGINVYDICDVAMEAKNPVRFKADCAAFINSDIRTALQEGYGRKNIIGGLVYSIATNYLNKVKGSRPIGKKIFFQGGVAKNSAVGYAFAQATGREIIIPPHPELIGAFGIALIAVNKFKLREISQLSTETTLSRLIAQPMSHIGNFTCKACKNLCTIERYEVGGRKFPFGGRCTLYESQWKNTRNVVEKEDTVAYRNELIFKEYSGATGEVKQNVSIGIPRALLTHTLYPLFSTFFKEMGFTVVLSDINKDMELVNAPFCYPIQILHGAVWDLDKKLVSKIFLPHVHSLEGGEGWQECTFCPITQASPYIIAPIFEDAPLMSPTLDYSRGYRNNQTLIRLAVDELNVSEQTAKTAWSQAVDAQEQVENVFIKKGKELLAQVEATNQIGIIIVGRSYNAFPRETSQSIPKKLASMGYSVIPFDFLEKKSITEFPWYYANYVKEAVELCKKSENLYLLYINSFSCTIDAFIQNYVKTEMGDKPYLLLELDAHVADAGTQTRLEAFLEIVKNYRKSRFPREHEPFQLAKLELKNKKHTVITSSGDQLDLKDPRIKICIPPFSKFHDDAIQLMFKSFGFNVAKTPSIITEFPVEGLKHSSGQECIPLAVALGHILHLVNNRKPGDVIAYFMLREGSPCVVCSYYQYIEQFLERNQIEDVFLFALNVKNEWMGVPLTKFLRVVPTVLILSDTMNEIESSLQVVGTSSSLQLLYDAWERYMDSVIRSNSYRKGIHRLIQEVQRIPKKGVPQDYSKVLISGDFFVRFSSIFLRELKEIYQKEQIIVKSTGVYEILLYGIYRGSMFLSHERDTQTETSESIFKQSVKKVLEKVIVTPISHLLLRYTAALERNLRKRFEKSGLLYGKPINIVKMVTKASEKVSPLIYGETVTSIGTGMETLEDPVYDSLIITGPQYCLPYRIAQAILKPVYLDEKVPFLVFDAEISAISPNVRRLVAANIEQIKRRKMERVKVV